jgi:hypothetical protein
MIRNRNIKSTINFIRVLDRITKDYPTSQLELINENSFQIIKKLLKYDIHLLNIYSLKIIKRIFKYVAKTKKTSLQIIYLVFENLKPEINDDWMYF